MRSRVDKEETWGPPSQPAPAEVTAPKAVPAFAAISLVYLLPTTEQSGSAEPERAAPGETLSTSTRASRLSRGMFVSRSQWRPGHCVEMRTHHAASPLGPIDLVRLRPSASAQVSGWRSSSHNTEMFKYSSSTEPPPTLSCIRAHICVLPPRDHRIAGDPRFASTSDLGKEMQPSLDIVWILLPLSHNVHACTVRSRGTDPRRRPKQPAVEADPRGKCSGVESMRMVLTCSNWSVSHIRMLRLPLRVFECGATPRGESRLSSFRSGQEHPRRTNPHQSLAFRCFESSRRLSAQPLSRPLNPAALSRHYGLSDGSDGFQIPHSLLCGKACWEEPSSLEGLQRHLSRCWMLSLVEAALLRSCLKTRCCAPRRSRTSVQALHVGSCSDHQDRTGPSPKCSFRQASPSRVPLLRTSPPLLGVCRGGPTYYVPPASRPDSATRWNGPWDLTAPRALLLPFDKSLQASHPTQRPGSQ